MPTLHQRVEDYIGQFADVDALDVWLTQGSHRLIDAVGEDVLGPFSRIYGFSYTGLGPGAGAYRVWAVAVAGHAATFVPASRWPQVSDEKSVYRATVAFPAWTWYDGRLVVHPHATTTFIATPKASVSHLATTIDGVPGELTQAVVLYAALNGQLRQLNQTLAEGVSGLVFATSGTVPTPPGAPTFTHDSASSGVSLPSSITVPVGTAPTFTPPVHAIDFTGVVTRIDTEEDIELAGAKLNEVLGRLKDYEAELATAAQDFQAEAAVYQSQLGVFAKNAELTLQALIESSRQSADLAVRNADAETARQVAEYTAKLQKYAHEVQAYVGVSQGEAQRFDAEVKRVALDLQGMQAQLGHIRLLYAESLAALGLVPVAAQEAVR